jgi:hypothetical protein
VCTAAVAAVAAAEANRCPFVPPLADARHRLGSVSGTCSQLVHNDRQQADSAVLQVLGSSTQLEVDYDIHTDPGTAVAQVEVACHMTLTAVLERYAKYEFPVRILVLKSHLAKS